MSGFLKTLQAKFMFTSKYADAFKETRVTKTFFGSPDVVVLAIPVGLAVLAHFTMVGHVLGSDPALKNYSTEATPNETEEMVTTAEHYHHNPVQRFFQHRLEKDGLTNGASLFSNEPTDALKVQH